MSILDFDLLIVGSGLAGLSAALQLAPMHRVAVITKRGLGDGASGWAQGGIAAVLAEGDSFDAHVQDTLTAGARLCDPTATRFVVENAPATIHWLQSLGVPFSLEDGALHLTREGGHSARRIVHATDATDATGAAVQRTLIAAVRGEGGQLKLPGGARFMPAHDARAELAPRDVVARAIDFEMKKNGLHCAHLDISHQSPAFLQAHFPNILARCAALGIDITREPIPVVPAAHYTCGGVLSDLAGRTDLHGLYAIGETACTGLHGANRLASNSLLECMVFARAAAAHIVSTQALPDVPRWDDSRVSDADECVVISHNWDELRRFMWDYVGIVRTSKRLARAAHRIALLQGEIAEFYAHFHVSRDLLELRNLVQVADLIVQSAQLRQESRGLHYSRDWPELAASAAPTILVPQ